jgi:serine/threonine protein kinase
VARTPLREGDPSRISGYRVKARLGAGGMGVVYLAVARDGRQVAIKVPRLELADDGEFRARFRREVAALQKVRGLCTVVVIEADTESARPFLVTEYADGPTLSEWVASQGALRPDMVYGLVVGLAEALMAIHEAGVVHRDLKPGNVLLTAAGPKVIDFGIAQVLEGTVVTKTGITVGSPGFMAPEQVLGAAGRPADVFAWALTVTYAATGQLPFGTGPNDAVFYRVLHQAPDVSGVPPQVRPLVEKALSKQPEDRPAAADLLVQLLSASGQAHPGEAPTQAALARSWMLPASGLASPAVAPAARHRRPGKRFLIAVGAGVAAAALAGGGAALLSSQRGTPPAGAGSSRPPATGVTHSASTGPASSTPSASAPAPGGISVGPQNCAFNAADGDYVASVVVSKTVCRSLSTALAADGQYWWPVDYQPPAVAGQQAADIACTMTADGMTMSVYDLSTNSPATHPAMAGVANAVCQTEEAHGWLPS